MDRGEALHQRVEVGLAQDPEVGVVDGDGALGPARTGDEGLAPEGFPAFDRHAAVERVHARQQGHLSGLDDVETVRRLTVAEDRVSAFVTYAEQPVGDRAQVRRRQAAKDGKAAYAVGYPYELVAMAFDCDRVGDDSRAQAGQGTRAPLVNLLRGQTLAVLQIFGHGVAGDDFDGGGGESDRDAQYPVKLLARQHPDAGLLGGYCMVRVRGAGDEGMLTWGRPVPVYRG